MEARNGRGRSGAGRYRSSGTNSGVMEEGNKITINDVAKAAGVSKGTVDRVLHDRGEVSQKSREKILKVIKELGYRPNFYASILASRKNYLISCIIPEFNNGEFWELTEKGIDQGREYAGRFGISINAVLYDQYDLESFQDACEKVLASRPSGVVIAPMFRNETLKFVKELTENHIPYVYIDSKLEDDGYLAYYGMPMYQSGYLCADILTDGRDVRKVHVIRIARDKRGLSDPTLTRRTGLVDYISEHFPDCDVENTFIDPKSREERYRKLDEMFASDPDPDKYIVMCNSRVHFVAEYLRDRGIRSCRVVGFDVLEKNVSALKDGYVQALIAQHSDRQAASAITAITDYLILHSGPQKKDNYTQMDILNKYNCDYYL